MGLHGQRRPVRAWALLRSAALLILTSRVVLAQADVRFTASVDRDHITTDEMLSLDLTLAGAFLSSSQPEFASLEGFAVVGTSQSSQYSVVNGQQSSRIVFTYRLRPTTTGKLTIPSVSVEAGNQTYETLPVTIEVTQGATPQAGQPTEPFREADAPRELTGQDLYAEADVDNKSPVVGQQITYMFRFYRAINLLSQPSLIWPDFAGFLSFELSPDSQHYQQAAGREYLVTEVRRALFPTVEGVVSIAPATLTIPGGLLYDTVRLQTNTVPVDVQSLPEGAPVDFAGYVGQFEIEAWLEPFEGRVNEVVTLSVRVFGKGNVGGILDPTEEAIDELQSWRAFDPQVTLDVWQDGDSTVGEKLFARPLLPQIEGELTIPPIGLDYYDPELGTYRRAETSELAISIAPPEARPDPGGESGGTKRDVLLLASDIRHIKPAAPALAVGHSPLLGKASYWIGWAIPLVAVVHALLRRRRRRRLEANVGYVRASRAERVASKRLSQARALAEAGDDDAYASVCRALTEFLADRFNVPPAGLTRDRIAVALKAQTVSGNLLERLLVCLDWADSGRFAPVAAGRRAEELVDAAQTVVAQLDNMMGEPSLH